MFPLGKLLSSLYARCTSYDHPSNIEFLVASTRQGTSKRPSVQGDATEGTSLLAFREDRTYLLVARTNYNSGRCIQEGINISCDAAVGPRIFFSFLLRFLYLLFHSILLSLGLLITLLGVYTPVVDVLLVRVPRWLVN